MNDAKFQALLDMFEHFGPDLTCTTSEWCDLTCEEQMTLENLIDCGRQTGTLMSPVIGDTHP